MRTLADLLGESPDIPWREPVRVSVDGIGWRYACRICIALGEPLTVAKVGELPEAADEIREHIAKVHTHD